MPALHILSLALAAACLAGVNLYLTAFLAGLAGRIGWLPVEGDHAVIGVLAHPAVMTVAALLYLLEAIVDKIPAVDSLWDALHTVIRPAGAVMLALHIMGNADPAYQALAGVLAGVAGLTTHLTKSSARLLINNSPGPLTNILVSIGEDILVAGLFVLTVHQPLAGFIVCFSLVALLWLMFPRMFRVARASLFLMWKKVRLPAGALTERVRLPAKISADQDMLMHGELPGTCTVQWAVRCVTGHVRKFPGLTPNMFGHLIRVKEHPGVLVFVGRRWFRHRPGKLSLAGCDVQHESGFLSEDVVIYNKAEKQQIVFRFTRAEEALAAHLAEEIQNQVKQAKSSPEPEREPLPAITEKASSPASDEMILPPLIVESIRPLPLPVAPEPEASAPNPITPFPAETSEPPVSPGFSSTSELPPTADVPPMPSMNSPAADPERTPAS